jgi:nucleotide-binding universal stress UspA family protein
LDNSILIALNDSVSSRAVLDYVAGLSLCPDDWRITLIHLFKKTSASEQLMGKKFTAQLPSRFLAVLENAKDKLVEDYPTVADGIIDQFNKGDFNMVVIGRKRMSKAEEFVMGDISIKLVRALEGAAVLVVKPQ